MVNLPLSCAKTARCCVWEARARELTAARHTAKAARVTFDLKGLRIIETTPCRNTTRTIAKDKVCHTRDAKRGDRARLRSECYRHAEWRFAGSKDSPACGRN